MLTTAKSKPRSIAISRNLQEFERDPDGVTNFTHKNEGRNFFIAHGKCLAAIIGWSACASFPHQHTRTGARGGEGFAPIKTKHYNLTAAVCLHSRTVGFDCSSGGLVFFCFGKFIAQGGTIVRGRKYC